MPAATGAVLEQHRGTGSSSDQATSAGEPRLSVLLGSLANVSLDRSPSSPKGPKALARPHSSLDRSMILFHDVVQVLHRSQLASPSQRALAFQLFHDRWVRRILIHVDHPWRGVVR